MFKTMNNSSVYLNIMTAINVLSLMMNIKDVSGHGRLIDPPSRSSAWRFGFNTTINYNDNELFCGGFNVQWNINRGKCGVCGDPYNGKKDNELPNGKYVRNLAVTRTYEEGSIIDIKVDITANHNGFFVFKICPTTNKILEVTQDCLNQFPLTIINSDNPDKYFLPSNRAKTFTIKAKLPTGLMCSRCVLQWTYVCGNNWGKCDDGISFKVGCGPQETFRGCADVRIIGRNFDIKNTHIQKISTTSKPISNTLNSTENIYSPKVTTMRPNAKPYVLTTRRYTKAKTSFNSSNNEIEDKKNCRSLGVWRAVPNMNQWCLINCSVGYCPSTHCICA